MKMPSDYSEEQIVELPDMYALKERGWASLTLSLAESDLREHLLALAAGIGTPTATRSSATLCDSLSPTAAYAARPRSLSRVHDVGEFPLHNDTAHWVKPCRYVILACTSPGSGRRPTLLMDTRRLPLSARQVLLLSSTPLRVRNGRNSFFATVLSKSRPFVRFDPGCMTATTPDGAEALAVLDRHNWPNHVEAVNWEVGTVLIIDNWRTLHGRGHATGPDFDRTLLRLSIL